MLCRRLLSAGGLHLRGRIETLPGNWAPLFQNIHEVISEGKAPLFAMDDILEQIRVLEGFATKDVIKDILGKIEVPR